MNNPLENPPKQEKKELSIIAEQLHLVKGTAVRLIKRRTDDSSAIKIGDILQGILDEDVQLGRPIYLNYKKSNTSPIVDIDEKEGLFFLKTQTSEYELIKVLTLKDWKDEVADFNKKGYGDFNAFAGKVPFEDDPYYRLLTKSGFKEGDLVMYYSDGKERKGMVEFYPQTKSLVIRDKNGNANGFVGFLLGGGGYIRKATPEDK